MKEISVKQAAAILQVSPRTIRRWIKDGSIKAHTIVGIYGPELRITQLPQDKLPQAPLIQAPDTTMQGALDMIRALQQENQKLALELGATQERNKQLEEQAKLLAPAAAPRIPWYRRIFRPTSQ